MDDVKRATVVVRVQSRAQLAVAKPHVEAALRGAKNTVGAILTTSGVVLATYKNKVWSEHAGEETE